MLPMKLITGEQEARHGISRPNSSFTLDRLSTSSFEDIDDCASPSMNPPTPPPSQPRSVPSPVVGLQSTTASGAIRSANQASKFHSLNIFNKLNSRPTSSGHSSYSRSSNVSSSPRPRSASSSSRNSIGAANVQTINGHQRVCSQANFGPQPPASPTPSFDSPPLSASPSTPSFLKKKKRGPSPSSSRRSFGMDMLKPGGKWRRSHLDEEYEAPPELALDPRHSLTRHASNPEPEYVFDESHDEDDFISQSDGELMAHDDGFYMVQGQHEAAARPLPPAPLPRNLLERRGHGAVTPLYPSSAAYRNQRHSISTAPTSAGMYSRSASIPSVTEEAPEVEEKTKAVVAEILRPRLSSIYSFTSSKSDWSSRGAATSTATFDSYPRRKWSREGTEGLDMESLEELEMLMDDMHSMETDTEREVRLLMLQMTTGQDVVRKQYEIPEYEVVRSPALPQEHSPALRKFSRSMMESLHTPIDDEVDDETSHEIQMLMNELSMSGNPNNRIGLGFVVETPLRERSMVENDGLVEMPSEYDIDTTLTVIDDEEQDQFDEEPHELRLRTGLDFADLDIVEEELALESLAEEEEQLKKERDLLDQLDAVADIDRLLTPNRDEPLLLHIPQRTIYSSSSNKSASEPGTPGIKIKVKEAKAKTRKHNLKENEVRVEDPAYLAAFKAFLKGSAHTDTFVCRQPRFDAMQTRRICNELPHEYRPLPPPPREEVDANAVEDPELPQAKKLTPEERRAKDVREEIVTRLWVFMAARWLNYNRLLISPAHEILYQSSIEDRRKRNRNSRSGKIGPRRRVLDLGGAPVADWGWHCAYEYPQSKVYTVTSRPKNINIDNVEISGVGVVEKRRFTGPSNHRHIKVSTLWKLPFPDNHFDVVSARSLHSILKQHPPQPRRRSELDPRRIKQKKLDEYALTLRECYRVLKPGGYFEYNVMDADVLCAGPASQDLSKRFADDLLRKGYDPIPTAKWIPRLHKAGFTEIRRTWIIVPMTPPSARPKPPPKRDLSHEPMDDLKAAQLEMEKALEALQEKDVVKGNTKDVTCISGLVGNWRWEEWMVKLDGERSIPEGKKGLVKGIGATLEEGREKGSGWRSLVGWAKKPTRREKALH